MVAELDRSPPLIAPVFEMIDQWPADVALFQLPSDGDMAERDITNH